MNNEHSADSRPFQPPSRLIPLTNWPDFHSWPTVPALRWHHFQGKGSPFYEAFRKVGGRVLLDEQRFYRIVDEHGKEGV